MSTTRAVAMRIAASGRVGYLDVLKMGAHEVLEILAMLDAEDETEAMRAVYEHRLSEHEARKRK